MSSVVASLSDTYIVRRETSNALINYDLQWNSWVQRAIEYSRFQQQHDLRSGTCEMGLSSNNVDMFLSVICVVTSSHRLSFKSDNSARHRSSR